MEQLYANEKTLLFEPIHYWQITDSSEGKKHLDDKNRERDNAFLKYGWTVVRFSETQVSDSVQTCCDIVNYLVNYLSVIPTTINLEEIDIKVQKRWTKDEAILMSTEKSRQNGEPIQLEYTKFSIDEYLDSNLDET